MNDSTKPSADWLKPPEEQAGIKLYLETARERIWLILATVIVVTGVAVAYVATTDPTYEAEADLLITPADSGNPIYGSLGLIQSSADPTRDVETASRMVTNIEVAQRVAESLGLETPPENLLGDIQAQPVAQSMIVALTSRAGSPESAKALADTFAMEAVAHRTEQLHSRIDEQLPRLRAQTGGAGALGQTQINRLQLLRSGPDPTMRVESLAIEPSAQASPRPALSVAAGLFAGIVLGLGAAFMAQALDPRLRRESQLRRLYRLPVLGRIPVESQTPSNNPIDPRKLSPVATEAFRTLRATLARSVSPSRQGGRVIFVTGSAASEGKTTTAINLATSFASSGRKVIVIESDLRRPIIGRTLGISASNGGVTSALLGDSSFQESLVETKTFGPELRFLLADHRGGWISELFSVPAAEEMLEEARRSADVVIIDSPPLNEVVDALPLAQHADEVLLVARIGVTRLDRLAVLGELLAENGIRPVGFAVVGTSRPKRSEYHYYADAAGTQGPGRQLRRRSADPVNSDSDDRTAPKRPPPAPSPRSSFRAPPPSN